MHNGTSYTPEDDNRGTNREIQFRGDSTESPFEAIRQVDERGEFWSARGLMPEMDYEQWRQFEDVIDRARAACRNSGFDDHDHFADARKITTNARGHRREIDDYRLTRYAAYLVAQNGDPRKAAIAKAQTYFAVQTHKQELAETSKVAATSQMLPVLSRKDMALMILAAEEELERAHLQIEASAPKVKVFDDWLDPDNAVETTDFAKRIGLRSAQQLNGHLRDLGIMRRDVHPRTKKPRNLPTADWGHCFKVVPTRIPTGGFVDVAWILPEGQLEIVEELRNNGLIDV